MGCWEFRWYQLGRVPTLPRYLPVPGYLPNLWNRGRYGRYRYRRGTVPTYLGTVRYLRYRTYLGIGTSRYRYLPNCNKLFFLEDWSEPPGATGTFLPTPTYLPYRTYRYLPTYHLRCHHLPAKTVVTYLPIGATYKKKWLAK